MTALRGRRGQSIPVDEYPRGHMDRINETLNGISAEPDEPVRWFDRLADRMLDMTEGRAITLLLTTVIMLSVVSGVAEAIRVVNP